MYYHVLYICVASNPIFPLRFSPWHTAVLPLAHVFKNITTVKSKGVVYFMRVSPFVSDSFHSLLQFNVL
jgi:hypothetical protein